jgi:phosphoheptose isomerase
MTSSKSDPRTRNDVFKGKNPFEYLQGYISQLGTALGQVDPAQLEAAVGAIEKAAVSGKTVYAAGNGGSAAIAGHLCCDWSKGTFFRGLPPLKAHSLAANTALLTAVINDFGVEEAFAYQIEIFGTPGDVVVLISSSGDSPNILEAARRARSKGIVTIGMTGFKGGKLLDLVDVKLYVPASNYGVVEDAHQSLMHVMAQFLVQKWKAAQESAQGGSLTPRSAPTHGTLDAEAL